MDDHLFFFIFLLFLFSFGPFFMDLIAVLPVIVPVAVWIRLTAAVCA